MQNLQAAVGTAFVSHEAKGAHALRKLIRSVIVHRDDGMASGTTCVELYWHLNALLTNRRKESVGLMVEGVGLESNILRPTCSEFKGEQL